MYTSVPVSVFMLGDDEGHFQMDRETGEMRLIQAVRNRLATPTLRLQVMVSLTCSMLVVGLKVEL